MITRKFFFITFFAVLAFFAGYAQSHEEGGISPNVAVHKVELYPNPAIGVLNVRFETPCTRRIKLAVHNVIGNPVEVETEIIDEYEIQLKVRDLTEGYYLLSIRDPDTNSKSTYKFVKR